MQNRKMNGSQPLAAIFGARSRKKNEKRGPWGPEIQVNKFPRIQSKMQKKDLSAPTRS